MNRQTYSLAEVRSGTGWPKGARFAIVNPAGEQDTPDTKALDRIAALLTNHVWSAGTIETVAALVRDTGRTIDEPGENRCPECDSGDRNDPWDDCHNAWHDHD